MTASFIAPEYCPTPYSCFGLTREQLPASAQYYLTSVAFIPPAVHNREAIRRRRSKLRLELCRDLRGTDRDLVQKWCESRVLASMAVEQGHGGCSEECDWCKHSQVRAAQRVHEVLQVILPERKAILDDFMVKFDALVWLDGEGREGWSAAQWQKYRNELCSRIFQQTQRTLVALGNSMEGRIKGERSSTAPNKREDATYKVF